MEDACYLIQVLATKLKAGEVSQNVAGRAANSGLGQLSPRIEV